MIRRVLLLAILLAATSAEAQFLNGSPGSAYRLAVNPTDCSAGQVATSIDERGNLGCTAENAGTDITADLEEEAQIGTTDVTGNAASAGQVCRATGANACTWAAPQWGDLSSTLGNSQQVPWGDVGIARSAAGEITITDGSTGAGDVAVVDYGTQAVSVSDNGVGSSMATFNLDPQKSYIEVTCSDADGCVGTLQETSAREGRYVTIVNVSASNKVKFSTVTNVATLWSSPLILDPGQSLTLLYDGGAYVQHPNIPFVVLKEDGTFMANLVTLNLDNRFSLACQDLQAGSCDAGEVCTCDLGPGSEFTMLGSTIEKTEIPSAVAYEDEANTFSADQTLNNDIRYLFGSSGVWSIKSNGTNLTITRESGTGSVTSAAPATLTGTWDFGGGGLAAPSGTGTAPTGTGRLFLKTNAAPNQLLSYGNGTAALNLKERHAYVAEVQKVANDQCTGSATPDACCSGALAGTCTGQPIADGTLSSGVQSNWEAINWGGELTDADAIHDLASAATNVKLGQVTSLTGHYLVGCQLEFAADADGQRCCAITSTYFGATLIHAESCVPAVSATGGTAAKTPCYVATEMASPLGDVECWAWSSHGSGTLDVLPSNLGAPDGTGYGSKFWIAWLGE